MDWLHWFLIACVLIILPIALWHGTTMYKLGFQEGRLLVMPWQDGPDDAAPSSFNQQGCIEGLEDLRARTP